MPKRGAKFEEAERIRQEVKRLTETGLAQDEIASRVNRSETRVRQIQDEFGMERGGARQFIRNPHRIIRFCKLLLTGEFSIRQLKQEFSFSEGHCWDLLHEAEREGFLLTKNRKGREVYYSLSLPTQLVSMSEYAALCGVDRTSIRDRIKSGTLLAERRKSASGRVMLLIDTKRFPPQRKR